jgi:hypothetical protein
MIRQILETGPFYLLGNVGSCIGSLSSQIFVKEIYTFLELEAPLKLRQSPNGPLGLRAGRPGDRGLIPAEAKDFSCSLCVQTGSGAHPASCTMGPFPGAKARPGSDADHLPPSSAEVENE